MNTETHYSEGHWWVMKELQSWRMGEKWPTFLFPVIDDYNPARKSDAPSFDEQISILNDLKYQGVLSALDRLKYRNRESISNDFLVDINVETFDSYYRLLDEKFDVHEVRLIKEPQNLSIQFGENPESRVQLVKPRENGYQDQLMDYVIHQAPNRAVSLGELMMHVPVFAKDDSPDDLTDLLDGLKFNKALKQYFFAGTTKRSIYATPVIKLHRRDVVLILDELSKILNHAPVKNRILALL